MWAGVFAGIAVLAKSSLIVVAPFALIPILANQTRRRTAMVAAAVGAVVPLSLWAAFEFARFGRLFGGYDGEVFSHPWLDGLWRLTIGPKRRPSAVFSCDGDRDRRRDPCRDVR